MSFLVIVVNYIYLLSICTYLYLSIYIYLVYPSISVYTYITNICLYTYFLLLSVKYFFSAFFIDETKLACFYVGFHNKLHSRRDLRFVYTKRSFGLLNYELTESTFKGTLLIKSSISSGEFQIHNKSEKEYIITKVERRVLSGKSFSEIVFTSYNLFIYISYMSFIYIWLLRYSFLYDLY